MRLKEKIKAILHPQESQNGLQNYTHNNNFLEKQKRTEVPSSAPVMQHNSERPSNFPKEQLFFIPNFTEFAHL